MKATGAPLTDAETLERIRALAIPPAWTDVWICPDALGHLQATGIDSAGRKQYVYHPHWRERRDHQKFEQMLDFGRRQPKLRRRADRDLRRSADLDRNRVLACAVRLLDLGFFRVGGEDYADRNESYGLATILKRHVSVEDGTLRFDYPAKGGARRVQAITDPMTLTLVGELKRRRGGGQRLLAYRSDGKWSELHAEDINEYLQRHVGEEFSAKDFRTWNATVLAAVALAQTEVRRSRSGRERAVAAAVKGVALFLGNTPAIARKSYIDPRVFDRYRAGATIATAMTDVAAERLLADRGARERIEAAVLDLLDGAERPASAAPRRAA